VAPLLDCFPTNTNSFDIPKDIFLGDSGEDYICTGKGVTTSDSVIAVILGHTVMKGM
jgi:hypothetical protein